MAYAELNKDYIPAKIVIGSYEFLNSEYRIDSISFQRGCYDGNSIGVGSAYTPSCTVNMEYIDGIVTGTTFQLWFYISGGWKKYGVYTVKDCPAMKKSDGMISFTGYGNMDKLDVEYTLGIYFFGVDGTVRLFQEQFYDFFGFELYFDSSIETKLQTCNIMHILPVYKDESDCFVRPYHYDISWKEFLQGLCILCGANLVEELDGNLRVKKLQDNIITDVFSSKDYDTDYSVSPNTYALKRIIIYGEPTAFESRAYDPTTIYDQNKVGPYLYYSGQTYTEEQKRRTFELSGQGDIPYDFTITCNWLGASIDWSGSLEKTEIWSVNNYYFVRRYVEPVPLTSLNITFGEFYTGEFSFAGINEKIVPGAELQMEVDGQNLPVYAGEVSYVWDGGFTTTVSSNIDNSTDSSSTTMQSNVTSSASYNAALALVSAAANNYTKINFADITFSNIKDSTISGSKFIDGSITGSKIADSTIEGSKFVDGSIVGSKIDFATFANGSISGSAIDTSTFIDGTITGSKIQDSTLTGAKIVDATISFEKVDTSFITKLTANSAYIEILEAQVANIHTLTADSAIIQNIQAVALSVDYIKSAVADVGYLTADEADILYADIALSNIDIANINKANIGLLFNAVGLIDRATIVDGHITGFLDAVDVNANKITAGTLIADRILLKGSSDGLLYALNNLGELTSATVDTLDGYVLTERTVSADRIVAGSITANELDVESIFADTAVIESIFAQDITATGTITGATLVGAYVNIDGGFIGPFAVFKDSGLNYSDDKYTFKLYANGIEMYTGKYQQVLSSYSMVLDRKGIDFSNGYCSAQLAEDIHTSDKTRPYALELNFFNTGSFNGKLADVSKSIWYGMDGIHGQEIWTSVSTGEVFSIARGNFLLDFSDVTVDGRLKAETLVVTGGGVAIRHSTTPYIDFHYADSSASYTSRIIEESSGTLAIKAALNVSGNVRLKNNTNYGSKLNFGDGDYVHIHEYEDDRLRVKANTLLFQILGVDYGIGGYTYGTSSNFRYYKYYDGRLVLEFCYVTTGRISVSTTDGNAYYYQVLGSKTFPVAFTAMPMVFSDIGRTDYSAPFMSLSLDYVSKTGFQRGMLWCPSNISTTSFPAGYTINALFIGRWK